MFIDTHAHIYLAQFHNDFDEIIVRAKNAGVKQILMPNIDNDTLDDVFQRSDAYQGICLPMIGLHPCSVTKFWDADLNVMHQRLQNMKVIAIGETGIDLYWDQTHAEEQKEAFRRQIDWALEYDLPIVIHSRSAINHTIEIIGEKQNGALRGVFHCFDQTFDEAKRIMDLGFYMGIGGVLTYKKNQELRDTVSKIPLKYLLLETDAPYLPPTPHRGKRNEPAYLEIIANFVARLKNTSVDIIGAQTTENARNLFRLPIHETP